MRYGGKRQAKQRPEYFRLDATHPLATGLVFAGLGYMGSNKSTSYHDSVAELLGSSAANHGTLTNMNPATDWVWVPELGEYCTNHGGLVNQYISIPDKDVFTLSNGFTLSAFGILTSDPNTTGSTIADKYDSGAYGDSPLGLEWVFGFSTHATETRLYGWVYDSFGEAYIGRYGIVNIPLNVPYHYAMTYSGGTTTSAVRLLVNNVQVDTTNFSSAIFSTITNTARPVSFGRRNTGLGASSWWKGFLGRGLIHDRVLSGSELSILADRSDPMLGGLILPPRRRLWGAVSVTTNRRRRILLGAAA